MYSLSKAHCLTDTLLCSVSRAGIMTAGKTGWGLLYSDMIAFDMLGYFCRVFFFILFSFSFEPMIELFSRTESI